LVSSLRPPTGSRNSKPEVRSRTKRDKRKFNLIGLRNQGRFSRTQGRRHYARLSGTSVRSSRQLSNQDSHVCRTRGPPGEVLLEPLRCNSGLCSAHSAGARAPPMCSLCCENRFCLRSCVYLTLALPRPLPRPFPTQSLDITPGGRV
jgi:hypothetical protein